MSDLRENILLALQQEQAPGQQTDVVTAGLVRALSVSAGKVSFILASAEDDDLRTRLIARARAVPGVKEAVCYLDSGLAAPPELGTTSGPRPIPGVTHTVLIGSGKGGVGKSTVSTNLALALADLGLRVGLLDADIYGPSVPQMMGTDGRPVSYDGTLIPIAAHGIRLLSVGLMMERDEALVWRGPILANTLAQLLHQVRWAPLDVLLIDLPPGTGDVQITLSQEAELSGAIIVTTPQKVALDDARRAVDLFRRTETPLLGVIENMSTHICSGCGKEEPIFPRIETEDTMHPLGLPLLGALPLEPSVCRAGEDGLPVVRATPQSASAQRFTQIAAALAQQLDQLAPGTA